MKYLTIAVGILTLAIALESCESPKSEQTSKTEPVNKYDYEVREITRSVSPCVPNPCTHVSIRYPHFKSPGLLNEQINAHLEAQLRTILSNGPSDSTASKTIERLMNDFLNEYTEFKNAFPESGLPWMIDIDAGVSYTNRTFISIKLSWASYTGGAHSNSAVVYLNVSRNGDLITDIRFFVNTPDKLKALAERKFREMQGMDSNESLAEKGFWFENNEFKLPEQIGFNSSGMVLYYNSYEIGPYAMGPIELILPFNDLNGMFIHKAL